ncbi:hypothetical protein CC79DRAFT_773314 [Sarocladium strictum]
MSAPQESIRQRLRPVLRHFCLRPEFASTGVGGSDLPTGGRLWCRLLLLVPPCGLRHQARPLSQTIEMLDLDRKEGPVSSSETTESTCICAKRSTGTRQRGPLRRPGSLLRSRLVLWDLGLAGPESLATAGIVKSCLQSQKALMCWSILLYAVAFEQSLHVAGLASAQFLLTRRSHLSNKEPVRSMYPVTLVFSAKTHLVFCLPSPDSTGHNSVLCYRATTGSVGYSAKWL